MVKTSNCGDLPIGYAHRNPEFLVITHQLTVDAGCGFVVRKRTLVEGQGDESFESFSEQASGRWFEPGPIPRPFGMSKDVTPFRDVMRCERGLATTQATG